MSSESSPVKASKPKFWPKHTKHLDEDEEN